MAKWLFSIFLWLSILWFDWKNCCKWAEYLFSPMFLFLGSKNINPRKAVNNYLLLLLSILQSLVLAQPVSVFFELFSGIWVSWELIPYLRIFIVYVEVQACFPGHPVSKDFVESAVERLYYREIHLQIFPLFFLFSCLSLCHLSLVFDSQNILRAGISNACMDLKGLTYRNFSYILPQNEQKKGKRRVWQVARVVCTVTLGSILLLK